jgi:spermidine/putrescine transport system substrate-binding protein
MTTNPRLPRSGLSRRSILSLLGAAPATAALSAAFPNLLRANAAGAFNIYSWPDYFSTDDLAAYTAKSGVTPNIATYNANEIMFAKLNSPAGAGFDIVIPSSGWIKQLADENLLLPLDHGKINFAALDPALLNRDYDPGNKYSIPKDWGLLGVVYDPDAVGGEINTWQDFFDAGAKPGVSGKVRLTKDAGETLGPALWTAGKDWNTATEADIRAAGEQLKAFAKHVTTFSGFDPAALASGAIVVAQANQAAARGAIQQNPKLKWVVPGPRSEIWVDNYAIAAKAENVDHAYDFLSFFSPAGHSGERDRISRLPRRDRRPAGKIAGRREERRSDFRRQRRRLRLAHLLHREPGNDRRLSGSADRGDGGRRRLATSF